MKNIIGLDISKVSTAMVIKNDKELYFSYNTNKPDYKWNKMVSHFVDIKTYEYDNTIKNYSLSEVNKLQQFSKISTDLINDIKNNIDFSLETIINIEGYSYGKSSAIIDIAGISSAIRVKIYEAVPNAKITIIAPKSLKLMVAELVYGFDMVEIGGKNKRSEKVIRKNNRGIAGGNFDKIDMLHAIKDYNKNDKLSMFIKENFDVITEKKEVPKPIEDINDSFWLSIF